MDAVEKSIERHKRKAALRERQAARRPPPAETRPVPWGCGLGWPELKDYPSLDAYIAARMARDPEYSFAHDGRFWILPG